MVKNSAELYELFREPSAGFRTAPLWVWNDDMTREKIDFCLREFREHGFGGAFVHPRPGLITEYLSEEWFDRWGYALETAKELGLKLYIYDENSYPSGFAGGHVPSMLPDCFSTSAQYRIFPAGAAPDDRESSASWMVGQDLIRAWGMRRRGEKWVITADITEDGSQAAGDWEHVLLITRQEPQLLPWLGGFANVDLLRPEVTDAFLKCTYEEYSRRFGRDFGDHIPAVFSDEPAITGSTIYNFGSKNNVPFSYWLAGQFEQRNGYDLLPHLAALFLDVDCDWYLYPAEKVRYDYYMTLRYLWTDNFIRPVAEWCGKHGIAWTGHFMENYWPFAAGIATSPCVMANYEYMQWPGIDMLQTDILKDAVSDPLLITVLEISSVANQLGKERTLCETYGAGGWDASVEDFKRMADWLLVNGVTFINQHLSYTSIAGARKRDHPQSFDWREPWWEEYTLLNDYVAKVQTALSAGVMEQRILVLQPTTAGFLTAPEQECGNLAWKVPVTNPYMENYLDMLQRLTDGQWDFDLGDEFILENNGMAKDGLLVVGRQRYSAVVISQDTANLRESTRVLLEEYLIQGGILLAVGRPGPYMDGLVREDLYRRLEGMPGWKDCGTLQGLESALRQHIPNRVAAEGAFPTGVAHRRRRLEDGSVLYFFVNNSKDAFAADIRLEEGGIQEWDLFTEEKRKRPRGEDGGYHLELAPGETCLLICGCGECREAVTGPGEGGRRQEAEVKADGIRPEGQNVYPVDYCDLEMQGVLIRDVNVIHAGHLLFKRQGFWGNPWDNAIQFRNRIMDRNHYGDGSGFRLTYRFETEAGWKPDRPVELVAERGEYYSLICNGTPVQWGGSSDWLDKDFQRAQIGSLIVPGTNEVVLTAERFDVRLEPEAVYLRGDFGVDAKGEFRLTGRPSVGMGSWTRQGYPFYGGAFFYDYVFRVPEGCTGALLQLPKMAASCCSVWVNHTCAGIPGVNLSGTSEIGRYLVPGENKLSLRICGSLRNLLGPHHDPGKPRNNAWPQNWKNAPKYGRPSAEAYDLIDYGVSDMPRIFLEFS